MKHLIFISVLFVLAFSFIVYGQVPNKISYQGLLTTSAGTPVQDGSYDLRFDLFNNLSGGSSLWTETHSGVSVQRGTFSVILGSGLTALPDIFNQPLFVEVTALAGSGIPAPITFSPRSELSSAPYSLNLKVPATLSANNYGDAVLIVNNITDGTGIRASSSGSTGALSIGVEGNANSSGIGTTMGIFGSAANTSTANVYGVYGYGQNTSSGMAYGGYFETFFAGTGIKYGLYSSGAATGSAVAVGVNGLASAAAGEANGGWFVTDWSNRGTGLRRGVRGYGIGGGAASTYGVMGTADNNSSGTAYGGYFNTLTSGTGTHYGIYAKGAGIASASTYGAFVLAENSSTGFTIGGLFETSETIRGIGGKLAIGGNAFGGTSSSTSAVEGYAENTGSGTVYGGRFVAWSVGTGIKYGIYAYAPTSPAGSRAGHFEGNVHVAGTLSKASGSFMIDHPLEPENKYLYHSFVESPDMMNIYNGNVVLNNRGEAIIELPAYFDALNKDFRYQLTCIGGYANVYIAEEIQNNRFKIAGGTAGLKVSWEVTGVRKDKYAEANRIQVEVDKPVNERGKYLHPEVFGLTEEKGMHYEMHKQMAEERQKRQEESLKQRAEQEQMDKEMREYQEKEEVHRKQRLEEMKNKH